MTWHRSLGRLPLIGTVLLGGLVGGGATWASIPDSDQIIHGCYKTHGGDLRVIDPVTAQCGPQETAVAWNQAALPPAGGGGSAYLYLHFDPATGDPGIDPEHSQGVTAVSTAAIPGDTHTRILCITLAATPRHMMVSPAPPGAPSWGVVGMEGFQDTSQYCPAGTNAYLRAISGWGTPWMTFQ